MLREEAEREAERRNLEDPDRARYEFYAFDESAGMASDAWDVGRRLRAGPPPAADWPGVGPQTAAGGAPAPSGDPAPREPAPAPPEDESLFLGGPTIAETDPFSGPDVFAEPPPEAWAQEPPAHEEWADEDWPQDADRRRDRGGIFVKIVGVIVTLAGLAWTAMVVVLTTVLHPDSTSSVGAFIVAGVVGLLTILLGVTIFRS